MASRGSSPSASLDPRALRLISPRMSPIITGKCQFVGMLSRSLTNADGRVSLVLTQDYRVRPYLVRDDGKWVPGSIFINQVDERHLRYILGIGLERQRLWRSPPGQDGLRIMSAGWVLHFDCNPDLILAKSLREQNGYLATRDVLKLPPLRWASDLKFLAEQQEEGAEGVGSTVDVVVLHG